MSARTFVHYFRCSRCGEQLRANGDCVLFQCECGQSFWMRGGDVVEFGAFTVVHGKWPPEWLESK